MLFSTRSALLIISAVGASSVAPAEVGTAVQPMDASSPLVLASNNVPMQSVAPLPLEIEPAPAAAAS